ncbi:SUKH-4 family immunity protein [Streptomyces sp. LE64]|uniref:SUKH-4 family immunity protein n=1 Tax=Streptomyces sp. LE64 TaxID=3448653 RepID=UPI004041F996
MDTTETPAAPGCDPGALLRFERALSRAAEPMPWTTGAPSPDAGYGLPAATEAARGLLDLLRAELHGAPVPPRWQVAALVRPLARVPAPGLHLHLELPGRLLTEEFGAARISRCEDVDLPAALRHEPTRRFLQDVGLPEAQGDFVAARLPLRTLADHHARPHPATGGPEDLPPRAARLVPVGRLVPDTDVVVDGTTGEVLARHWPDPQPRPLNTDVSTLAFTLWLRHHVDAAARSHALTAPSVRPLLADAVRAVLEATDPLLARHRGSGWDTRAPVRCRRVRAGRSS